MPRLWSPRAHAELEITVGETLTVSLSTDNLSAAPFDLTEALHTYLKVGDIADVTVTGFEGAQLYRSARRRRAQSASAAQSSSIAKSIAFIRRQAMRWW